MTTNIAKFNELRALSLNESLQQPTIIDRLFNLWGRREVAIRNADEEIVAEFAESGLLKRHHGFFLPARELLTQVKQALTKLLHHGQTDLSCHIIAGDEEIAHLRHAIENFKRRSNHLRIATRWQDLRKACHDWRTDAAFVVSDKLLAQLPHRVSARLGLGVGMSDKDLAARPLDGLEFDFEREFAAELAEDAVREEGLPVADGKSPRQAPLVSPL